MTLSVRSLEIPDVKLITPRRHQDTRGYFCEAWNDRDLRSTGIDARFVQDNQSLSRRRGTIRGLHFQRAPFAQGKLVRVLRGRLFDVAVDLRPGSNTYGHWTSAELSSTSGDQLWIPRGFAHGFCTLEPDTEVLYKTDAYYEPTAETGLRWDDPEIGIHWPLNGHQLTLSDKDRLLPTLAQSGLANRTRLAG